MNITQYEPNVGFLYMVREEENYQTRNAGHSHPFDAVFKSMKMKHKNLFIPLINAAFGTHYKQNEVCDLLSTEGNFILPTREGTARVEERVSDFLLKIHSKYYLIECQSSNDDQMVIRLAEYAFLSGMQNAETKDGVYEITMPEYTVLYIRSNQSTPKKTRMKFFFPNGQNVEYSAPNILLADYSREDIVNKKLYLLIPYYILRYERDLKAGTADMIQIEDDLRYFMEALQSELETGGMRELEESDIRLHANTIIEHICGDKAKEEKKMMIDLLSGDVFLTEADVKWDEGKTEGANQLMRALTLLRGGECGSAQELIKRDIDKDIAEMAVQFMLDDHTV